MAVLIKQVPVAAELSLGFDGRLVRRGVELEVNPYCRRAITKGIELKGVEGTCVAFTLGPPSAEEVLREALAAGVDEGYLICDEAFAGSDTLATALALAAAVRRTGPFDLILAGLNSVDADTGQVAPEVAELLGWSFASGVRELRVDQDEDSPQGLVVGCERDDGLVHVSVRLPAVLSVAERLCRPAKHGPEDRAAVDRHRIRCITAADLGPEPWGLAASPTRVGEVRIHQLQRARKMLAGPIEDKVSEAVRLLSESRETGQLPCSERPARGRSSSPVIVLVEPVREQLAREVLGGATALGARVLAICSDADSAHLASWRADEVIRLVREQGGDPSEEEVARAAIRLVGEIGASIVIAPSTSWGRHVASRVAARLGAGLIGDAIDLDVVDDRLIASKPAFGGRLVAAISATSEVQMVTVRPGVFPLADRKSESPAKEKTAVVPLSSGVTELSRLRDPAIDAIARARVLIGVGAGVPPSSYDRLTPLLEVFRAELVGTRRVTDQGWLPRSRQVGLTGSSVSPDLYVAIAISGKFNHLVGLRGARTVLAINHDESAPIFSAADIGILGDWELVVALLGDALRELR